MALVGGGAPECDTMRGDFKFDRIDFRKFTDLSFLRNGVVSGTYAGIWDQYGPSFHVNSRLHRLNINQGAVRDAEVAMTWENNQLDLIASVDDEPLHGGMVMSYDGNDSLGFASVKDSCSSGI
ncbi:MAG: hypothetical protein V8S95_06725 [Odoribacter sp.]